MAYGAGCMLDAGAIAYCSAVMWEGRWGAGGSITPLVLVFVCLSGKEH